MNANQSHNFYPQSSPKAKGKMNKLTTIQEELLKRKSKINNKFMKPGSFHSPKDESQAQRKRRAVLKTQSRLKGQLQSPINKPNKSIFEISNTSAMKVQVFGNKRTSLNPTALFNNNLFDRSPEARETRN